MHRLCIDVCMYMPTIAIWVDVGNIGQLWLSSAKYGIKTPITVILYNQQQ